MSLEVRQIPLFPLNLVMFPGMVLPLHIFEERYRMMIGRCTMEETSFGIVYGSDEDFSTVGCEALVTGLLERFPDGRMNVLTRGLGRLRVQDHFEDSSGLASPESKPLIVGLVADYDDDEGEADPEIYGEVLRSYGEALRLVSGWSAREALRGITPEALSYTVPAQLSLEPAEKQAILEMQSTSARLDRVRQVLKMSLPGIRQLKRRTGGNGHIGSQPLGA